MAGESRDIAHDWWRLGVRTKPFRVGQRVRPSRAGIDANLFPGSKASREGTVQKVDRWNGPTVLWDVRKTADAYFCGFIEPVGAKGRKP